MYALHSNIEILMDNSDPGCTMVNDTETDCLISDQTYQSLSAESERLLILTDSQMTPDNKKFKNLL